MEKESSESRRRSIGGRDGGAWLLEDGDGTGGEGLALTREQRRGKQRDAMLNSIALAMLGWPSAKLGGDRRLELKMRETRTRMELGLASVFNRGWKFSWTRG